MRLARTIWDVRRGEKIAQWLKDQGVEVELQPYPPSLPSSWRLWVADEDQLDRVRALIDDVENGKIKIEEALQAQPKTIPLEIAPMVSKLDSKSRPVRKPHAILTQTVILLLIIIHATLNLLLDRPLADQWQARLMIDDPKPSAIESPSLVKPWPGLYTLSVVKLQEWLHETPSETLTPAPDSTSWQFLACVQQGQWWRLFTPILLHGDWLHLIFNILWLSVLGAAIETRLGSLRLGAIIISSGLASNFIQYVMSGYRFLGFSGIVMALVAFIYMRIQRFPWEGYPITSSTFLFIGFYLILTLCLQAVGFILDVFQVGAMSLGIANSAHFSGLAIGWLLGRLRAMSIRA